CLRSRATGWLRADSCSIVSPKYSCTPGGSRTITPLLHPARRCGGVLPCQAPSRRPGFASNDRPPFLSVPCPSPQASPPGGRDPPGWGRSEAVMKRVPPRPGPRRGAAAVELALLLPFLLALLLGVWEVGRLIQINQVLSNAAREGARQASTGEKTNDQVKLAVCQYLKNGGLNDHTPDRASSVTPTDLNNPRTDARP